MQYGLRSLSGHFLEGSISNFSKSMLGGNSFGYNEDVLNATVSIVVPLIFFHCFAT